MSIHPPIYPPTSILPTVLPTAQLIDTSWFLTDPSNGANLYNQRRYEDAKFLDITKMGHPSGTVHSLPSLPTYSSFLSLNSLTPQTPIILYQQEKGMAMYYAYYWLKYKAMHEGYVGCKLTPIQEGEDGYNIVTAPFSPPPCTNVGPIQNVREGWGKFVNLEFMKKVVGGEEKATILDVRGEGRFKGVEKEKREGVRSGHMRGSKNLPFPKVLQDNWCALKDDPELTNLLSNVVDLNGDGRIIVSCGSGVTACIVAVALEKVGVDKDRVAVYEG
eukprot:CAMPEP_0118656896 /NCGR_PEP_ID=MMETSP0785-20121206/13723_1 /TAXON_ID=91992 /ORGANISM="Bolidomonas pacifica, Strain CCMP 1866" /LENGTH=273 /DNA_ID=CAMNT_0006549765 /DNA_START=89 /DNA_END=906 /DNA_ORIENTATION=+